MRRMLVAGILLALAILPAAQARPLVDVQPTSDADAALLAVSVTGTSRGFYAISGTGAANGTMPVSLLGTCETYFFTYDDKGEPVEHRDTRRCFDVETTGDARGYWLATSAFGNTNSPWIGATGTGDASLAQSCLGYSVYYYGGSNCGDRQGAVLLSGTGTTYGDRAYLGLSGLGSAQGGVVAISLASRAQQTSSITTGVAGAVLGDASACHVHWVGCYAVSVFGNADGDTAISVFGSANGDRAISVRGLLP